MKFEENTVEISADDLLARPAEKEDEESADAKEERGTRLAEAMTFLEEELKDGPQPRNEIIKKARGEGITKGTLERAKFKLGVRSLKNGDGPWFWHPKPPGPNAAHEDTDDAM